MSSLKERNEKVCLNCGTDLYGRYCHACGQENVQPRRPFWEIPWHFVNNIVNVDGKFFSSFYALLFKPGFLAREFVSGHRTRHYDAVRAYLFTSFLFFFVAAVIFSSAREVVDTGEEQIRAVAADSLRLQQELSKADSTLKVQTGNALALHPDSIKAAVAAREGRGNVTFNGANDVKDFISRYEKDLQYMLWFSLPGFALILKLLYIRRKIFLWDHLVFALYLYSFNFLMICVAFLLVRFCDWVLPEVAGDLILPWLEFLLFMAAMIYAYLSMRNFYGQGYGKTALKFVLLSIMTLFLFLVEMILVFMVEYREQLFA